MEIIIQLSVLLPLLRSQVIAEVVMCLYDTFIVCFSIFLLVSITLVLEVSKLLIECFHGKLTPLKWLAISQQEDLQSDMSQFQLQWQNINIMLQPLQQT